MTKGKIIQVKDTAEFLDIWGKLNNPDFNCVEFDIIKSKAVWINYRLCALKLI